MRAKKLLSIFLIFTLLVLSACKSENEGSGYEITGSYDPAEYVELGEYKGLSMDISITDEELQEEINYLLEENQQYEEIREGEAKNGDTVNIDYEGSTDDGVFDGGTDTDSFLELGSGTFIDGFEEQIVGHKVGDEFTVNVTFPEDYHNEELVGKPAQFKVKLNYIRGEAIYQEFNDEFVKSLGEEGYDTVDEYKVFLKENMVNDKRDEALNELFTQVVEASNIKEYPSEVLESIRTRFEESNKKAIEYQFQSMENYLEMYKMTQEDYDKYMDESIKGYVGEIMIAELIAKNENIELTEEDFTEMLDIYLENHEKENEEELTEYFKEEFSANLRDIIHETIVTEKVMEFIEDHAEVKE